MKFDDGQKWIRRALAVFAACTVGAGLSEALAQAPKWPEKVVRIVTPFGPGGGRGGSCGAEGRRRAPGRGGRAG